MTANSCVAMKRFEYNIRMEQEKAINILKEEMDSQIK